MRVAILAPLVTPIIPAQQGGSQAVASEGGLSRRGGQGHGQESDSSLGRVPVRSRRTVLGYERMYERAVARA